MEDRKRPREHEDEEGSYQFKSPPKYGSQKYWEERYKRMESPQAKEDGKKPEHQPDPLHAWYFDYEELAPLLLPLILGEMGGEEGEKEQQEGGNEYGHDSRNSRESESILDDEDGQTTDDMEKIEEVEEEEEEEERPNKRVGLAKNGPIAILEVGCGDVPLGRDVIKNVQDLESVAGVEATKILKKVVCIDYSPTVVETMKQQEKESFYSTQDNINGVTKYSAVVPLFYEIVDARKMPYEDESFDLILEKGTLDAMLSDTEVGADNCRSIVSECARALTMVKTD